MEYGTKSYESLISVSRTTNTTYERAVRLRAHLRAPSHTHKCASATAPAPERSGWFCEPRTRRSTAPSSYAHAACIRVHSKTRSATCMR
eukprot:2008110-Pleurochrysis_carterae.AAC.2